MNNFLRIVIAGGIATVLQRSAGLNPMSIEGFAVFLFIFMVVSFLYGAVANRKKKDEGQQESIQKNYYPLFKKATVALIFLFVLNLAVNFFSYKAGLLDSRFTFYPNTTSAVALNLKDKEPIESFEVNARYYFLYKENETYYLVEQNSRLKADSLLTAYSNFYMPSLFDVVKDRADYKEIINNLSPLVYKEYALSDFLLGSVWRFNAADHQASWSKSERETIEKRYQTYQTQKKQKIMNEKKAKYHALMNKDVKALSLNALHQLKKDLYSYYAYTKDTRYILAIFDEIEQKGDKKIDKYNMALLSYLYLFRAKEKLNDILLQKYNMGVTYWFTFWDGYPLDIDKQEYSHIRLSDLASKNKLLLWKAKIKEVKVVDGAVLIDFNSEADTLLNDFEKEDVEKISILLNQLIDSIHYIDKQYYQTMPNKR